MIEMKGEYLETVNVTKKGGFIRKFLATFADGSRGVVTVYSASRDALEKSGVVTIKVAIGDMVFVR